MKRVRSLAPDRLLVFSHKPCWRAADSPTGYATDGGFPMQMRALSELFAATTIVVPLVAVPSAGTALSGRNLQVVPIFDPGRSGWRRKLRVLLWGLCRLPLLLRLLRQHEVVHVPIPGDIGTIGMLLAYVRRQRQFIRYCGNWHKQATRAQKFWHRFLERNGGRRTVVFVTGAGTAPPSAQNPALQWIFATSLTEAELERLDRAVARRMLVPGQTLRLITAGRQEPGKGTDLIIAALAQLTELDVRLEIIGSGSALPALQQQAAAVAVADRVCFHGALPHQDVLARMQQASLFCFTSASEGFPKVVLEALACGLPVIASRLPVLAAVIGDKAGILLENSSPDAVATAIRELAASPPRYTTYSENARALARKYSLENWQHAIGEQLHRAWHGTP